MQYVASTKNMPLAENGNSFKWQTCSCVF